MKKYHVRITTESGDVYKAIFINKPDKNSLAKYIWKLEGKCADLDFYKDTITFEITESDLGDFWKLNDEE